MKSTCCLFAIIFSLAMPFPVFGNPTAPVVNGSTATYSGDQSAGITIATSTNPSSDTISTMNLSGVNEGVVVPGIYFGSRFNRSVSINIGSTAELVGILTAADGTNGVTATTYGLCSLTSPSGAVSIVSYGDIETTGTGSDGIYAVSSAGQGFAGSEGHLTTDGGAGSKGQEAGAITLDINGTIKTSQDDSIGVMAIGQGGGGGSGGEAGLLSSAGPGGAGGKGGAVAIRGSATIQTSGDYSSGVAAMSGGGPGGTGGEGYFTSGGAPGAAGGLGGAVAVDGDWSISTAGDHAIGIWAKSVGGNAGVGGAGGWASSRPGGGGLAADGGAVSLHSGGTVTTAGTASYGLHAQSVGGFGGAGGTSSSFFTSFGGDASSGGSGGSVEAVNEASGSVTTTGDYGHAISAQSIGGGGGSGGGKFGLFSSLGGVGAAGGNGGSVSVQNLGSLATAGTGAFGIFAQSVGGGGGDGGGAGGLVGIGGTGSQTSDGGAVAVENVGAILTSGLQAHGIFAESVGGGGGNGGKAGGLVALGGSGGSGGNAGSVSVVNEGSILTKNDESYGIFAQSVGGGGGSGGGSVSASAAVSFSMGGKGAAGGDAAAVTVESGASGTIATEGDRSYGIFAQSVGGGGGDGGYSISAAVGTGVALAIGGSAGAGGDGGAVAVEIGGSVATSGERAYAVIAQSVGGGGGAGGFSVAGSLGGGGLSLGLGGSGGVGGVGGAVTVDVTGSAATTGLGAHAVFAQSVGGGGGDGGFSIAGSVSGIGGSPSANFSVGGSGGNGNVGGDVVVTSSGTVSTGGDDAHGILAQSVGGSGGNGGSSISASIGGGVGLNLGFGGDGGTGSAGGSVTLGSADRYLSGTIETQGDRSFGILAQSIGGGGGNGGSTLTGSLLAPASISLSFGGSGGSGGLGDAVNVYTDADIATHGSQSHGILAQSVGGGGGTGGLSIAGGVTGFGGLSLAMGGDGGTGNTGGAVRVANSGAIETSGEYSYGLFAQSVGGKGGAGGTSGAVMVNFSSLIPVPEPYPTGSVNIALSLGGVGGSGGLGGAVDVDNAGTILTREDYSYGILAQSIGGGGGDGGKSVAATANISAPSSSEGGDAKPQLEVKVDFAVALGGNGGAGNHAGQVDLANTGAIETRGDGSHGVFAQAVGGGGGSGGSARSMILGIDASNYAPADPVPDPSSYSFGATLSLGGSGGAAGDGGVVNVANQGSIITRGADAYGILAQSVGGGGGIAGGGYHGLDWQDLGVSAEAAEQLDLAPIEDEGDVHITLGGSGTSGGGDGKAVTVVNSGSILTLGAGSIGLYAQSIGGGGGIGGAGATGAETGVVALGGSGGVGGKGGNIAVTQTGAIETYGTAAHGLFAQSVGGGGGYGGNADKGISEEGIDLTFGGGGGAGGDGGTVKIASAGAITTHGDGSIGILAQSVGGGGGIGGGIGDSYGFAGSVGKVGEGGRVEVSHTGDINTTGKYAHGILAQSVGGVGMGGDVVVTIAGNIIVTGEGSVAVLAQSYGQGGSRKIDFIYQSGTIIGNDDGAVKFLNGADNSFANRGAISTVGGPTGTAFLTSDGNDSITNYGVVTGSVNLGSGTNGFTNKGGATFNSGDIVNLGLAALSKLVNEGTFSPGGSGRTLVTTLTGLLEQLPDAKMFMELDLKSGLSDLLNTTSIADLAGKLQVGLLNAGFALDGSYAIKVISAAGGAIDKGLELISNPSAVMDYVLTFAPNGTDVLLQLIVDKTPEGLSAVQGKIGDLINRIQGSDGATSFAAIADALFSLEDVESLAAAYEMIGNPSSFDLTAVSSVETVGKFVASLVKRMHSVRAAIQTRDGRLKVRQVLPNAAWTESLALAATQRSVDGAPGYDPRVLGTVSGYDRMLKDGVLLGVSAGYTKTDVDVKDSADRNTIGSSFASLYGSLFTDKAYADAALTYGRHRFGNLRVVEIGSSLFNAESAHDGDALSAYLESGYNWFLGGLLLEPFASGRFGLLFEESYEETGMGGGNLRVDARTTKSLVSQLGARAALPFRLGTWTFIPELTVSWDHDFDLGGGHMDVAFESAPDMKFTVDGSDPARDGLSAGFGLTIISKNHVSVSADYKGQFREGYVAHSLVGGIRFEF